MLAIIIDILRIIKASNNLDDELIITNIKEEIISLVDRKMKNKDFVTLENVAKDLYAYLVFNDGSSDKVDIEICHVYEECKVFNDFSWTSGELTVNDPNLLNIFNFFKRYNVERVFLKVVRHSLYTFVGEKYRPGLESLLNQLSEQNGGPKFVYDAVYGYRRYIHHNIRCVNPNCVNFVGHGQGFKRFDFRITSDNRTGYIFTIDLEQLYFFEFLEKKVKLLFNDHWRIVYKFLTNFDLIKSRNFQSLIEKIPRFYFTLEYVKDCGLLSFIVFGHKSVTFYEEAVYTYDVSDKDAFKISFTIYNDLKLLSSYIFSFSYRRIEVEIFTLFSLSTKPLFTNLVKRILYSKISAKKIIFLEALYSLRIITRSEINWTLASIPDLTQKYVFVILDDSYVTKIVESIMNIELKDRTSVNYINFYAILFFELEIYTEECESAKDKTYHLLESYYKLLEIKDVCKGVEDRFKTTVANICNTYYGLAKNLNMLYNIYYENEASFNEYYHLVKKVLDDLLRDKKFLEKFRNKKNF